MITLGSFATVWVRRATKDHQEFVLLERARTVAATVNTHELVRIHGSERDIGTGAYEEIKAQMIRVRAVNPDIRFVYLMGMRAGHLFIFVDSEPPDSPDYSPPGQEYTEASEVKISNFLSATAFLEGPYTDRWGTWISGYAPVIDPRRPGIPLAVAGIDVDAAMLRREVQQAEALPVSATVFALALVAVLYHAARRRREIDKMKSEFVSLASHQLRTPLTGIKWFTDLLLRGKAGRLTKDQQDFVTQIAESNTRLIALVEDLLDVSRIETGRKFNIELKPTNIMPIINSLLAELSGFAGTHQITIKKTSHVPRSCVLRVDEQKIREVFANLLSNAIKYSKPGGAVEVDVKKVKGGAVIIAVKDSGLGIPKAQQSRIFEKFFRADNVQTTETSGTGLGLYIAKAIVEKHHGTLSFESTENMGTIFYVHLPARAG